MSGASGDNRYCMVDDPQALEAWKRKLEEHVTVIMHRRGAVAGRFQLADGPVVAALVQAYHEGVEGLRKRGH